MAVYTDVSADDLTRFLSGYDIGELLSYKGIAEGVENSNFLVHTSAGNFILTLYEKRVAEGDLPFFLGLMEHLAARGITCPQPVKKGRVGCSARSPGGPLRSSLFSMDCGSGGRVPATARRSARRWRDCISPARISSRSAQMHCRSRAGGRSTNRPKARGDSVRQGLCSEIANGARCSGKIVAAPVAARRHPRRSFSRQRVLPRRQVVRPDRLLFRLHRYARLRRRDLPQRLVLRARSFLQRHQRAERCSTPTARCARFPKPSETRFPSWRAARRCVSCSRVWSIGWRCRTARWCKPKDPLEYFRKLRFHQSVKSVGDYGLGV